MCQDLNSDPCGKDALWGREGSGRMERECWPRARNLAMSKLEALAALQAAMRMWNMLEAVLA